MKQIVNHPNYPKIVPSKRDPDNLKSNIFQGSAPSTAGEEHHTPKTRS